MERERSMWRERQKGEAGRRSAPVNWEAPRKNMKAVLFTLRELFAFLQKPPKFQWNWQIQVSQSLTTLANIKTSVINTEETRNTCLERNSNIPYYGNDWKAKYMYIHICLDYALLHDTAYSALHPQLVIWEISRKLVVTKKKWTYTMSSNWNYAGFSPLWRWPR